MVQLCYLVHFIEKKGQTEVLMATYILKDKNGQTEVLMATYILKPISEREVNWSAGNKGVITLASVTAGNE